MATTSISLQIQQAIQTILQALNLPGIESANVVIRLKTKVSDQLDTVPCVVISPYGSLGDKPADFEGFRDRQFRVRIAIVDGMEGDYATAQQQYQEWLEAALDAIMLDAAGAFARDTLNGAPAVWEINAENVTEFDDSALSPGLYAVQNLVLRFEAQR